MADVEKWRRIHPSTTQPENEMSLIQRYGAYVSDCRLNYIEPMKYSDWKKARGY